MTKSFKIEIDLGNAAFEDNPEEEIARILNEVNQTLHHMGNLKTLDGKKLYDVNGNHVGYIRVKL